MVSVESFSVPWLTLQFPFDAFPVIARPECYPSLLDDFIHFGGQLELRFFTYLRTGTISEGRLERIFTELRLLSYMKTTVVRVCKRVANNQIFKDIRLS